MNALQIAEVAPLAPAAAELLAPLGMLCILIVVYGMVLGVDAIVRGFFGTVKGAVGWIPYLGQVIESPVHKIEQKIVSFLAGLEEHIDSAIGHSWHSLASVATHLWHTLERESLLMWQALKFLSGVPTLHELLHAEMWLRREIKAGEVQAEHALRHAVRAEEHQLSSVAHNIYPRLRTIEHEVERTIPREIKHARALAREAEDGVAKLWKHVQSLPGVRYIDAAIATAIAALGLEGLNLLKCSEAGNLFKRRGCGLWTLLDGLLGVVISTLALENTCTLLPLLEASFGEVVGPVIHLLTEVPLGGCEEPPGSWAQLSVPAGPLPPRQTLGALPV